MAAELASSSDDSSSCSDDNDTKDQGRRSSNTKTKKDFKLKTATEGTDSTDEEMTVDLKDDKSKLKIKSKDSEPDEEELGYHRNLFQQKRLGLSNLGNSCYINCIIQILAHLGMFKSELER